MSTPLLKLLFELDGRGTRIALIVAAAIVAVLDVATVALIVPVMLLATQASPDALPGPLGRLADLLPAEGGLGPLTAALIGLVVVKNIAMASVMRLQTRVAAAGAAKLSQRLLRGYLAAPLEFHLTRESAQYTRGLRDLPVEICFTGGINHCNRIAEIAGIGAMVLALTLVEPVGVLSAAALLAGLIVLNQRLLGPELHRRNARSGVLLRGLYGLFSGVFRAQTLKVIRTTGSEPQLQRRIETLTDEYVDIVGRDRFVMAATRPVAEIAMILAGVIVLASMVWGHDEVVDAVPSLAAFAYGAFRLLPATTRVNTCANELRRVAPLVAEAEADLARTAPFLDAAAERPPPRIRFSESLTLCGVGYSYPGSARPALTGIDLEIRFGEVIGLVGASGAGKSTLVDILLGLLDPAEGEIRLDGRPVRRMAGEDASDSPEAAVGYVPQNDLPLDLTVREVVGFGLEPEAIDDARVWDALAAVRLDAAVEALPEGLEARIGEAGTRLSGGQRQRLGIARALYRRPALLILDEATSDLDTRTEFAVSETVNALRGRTTIVMVAHRLHVLKPCDRILFLEEGQVSATGNYEALMRDCPGFRDLAAVTERYQTPGTPETSS